MSTRGKLKGLEQGQKVNLIIATGQNNLAMNRTVAQIARHYIKGPTIPEPLLNRRLLMLDVGSLVAGRVRWTPMRSGKGSLRSARQGASR